MDKLRKQVRRARRRLFWQRFFALATWCLFATLLVAVIAVAVPKIWAIGVNSDVWTWSWLGGACGLGLLIAAAWALVTRRSSLEAAIEIDQRYGLKERVSSTLALHDAECDTDAGRALIGDAVRRVERIDVTERFGIRPRPWVLLPLAPAVIAFLLVVLFEDVVRDAPTEAAAKAIAARDQVKRSASDLKKKIAERRKNAEEEDLKDAEDLFKKLEAGVEDLSKRDVDRKKAMIELNDLKKTLDERRKKLGDSQDIKKKLGGLKKLKQGPADKVAKALQDGDLKKAVDEFDELRKKIENGELDEEDQQKLADQVREMEKQLGDAAKAHEQAKNDLQKQIDQARQAGDNAKADQLQRRLNNLAAQDAKMDQLRKMAEKLGQCSQCLEEGDLQNAESQLQQLADDLKQLQRENDEMEMIDDALDQIAECKNAMGCKACNGEGCQQCQGQGRGKGNGKGDGLGEGQGEGDRPLEESDTKFYDDRVRGRVGPGPGVITGEVEGPNVAGQAREEIEATIMEAKAGQAQPLTGQRLPRSRRDHVQQYLDSLREGE